LESGKVKRGGDIEGMWYSWPLENERAGRRSTRRRQFHPLISDISRGSTHHGKPKAQFTEPYNQTKGKYKEEKAGLEAGEAVDTGRTVTEKK